MTITKNVSNYNDISLANKSGLGIFPVALFLCLFGAVRLRLLTGRQKEILKQVQDDRSHTDAYARCLLK